MMNIYHTAAGKVGRSMAAGGKLQRRGRKAGAA